MNQFLLTTALEETWLENPEKSALFLVEWYWLFSRKVRWLKMNAEVLPYHWDDSHKLYNDYTSLNNSAWFGGKKIDIGFGKNYKENSTLKSSQMHFD